MAMRFARPGGSWNQSNERISARRRVSSDQYISSIPTADPDDGEAGGQNEAARLLERDRVTANDDAQGLTGHNRYGHSYGRPDMSKWLRPLALTLLIFLVTTLAISTSRTLLFTSASNMTTGLSEFESFQDQDQDQDQDQTLGIQIHPEDHVHRPPSTITQTWVVTSGVRSPDGVKKEIYLVNGHFPGPTIECRSGDRLVIHVTNNISSTEGISIHWHGLDMRGANHMDGASGFTQCPIPLGRTFRYEFDIDESQHGTFWWHAHSQVQRGDGMYGGLVVHKPAEFKNEMQVFGYDKEVLLLIGDWYHRSARDVLEWYQSPASFGNEPVPDSMLINGVGEFICSRAVPARPVECKDVLEGLRFGLLGLTLDWSKTRLRMVNTGSLAGFTVRVSGHTLTPLTVDGGFMVEGTAADSVGILYPGERVDLLLTSHGSTDLQSSRFQIFFDPEDFKYANPALQPNQSFPLISARNTDETRNYKFINSGPHFDLSTAVSTAQIPPQAMAFPTHAQQTILLYTRSEKLARFSNRPMGFINRTSWTPQSAPHLPITALPRSSWDANQFIPYIHFSSPSKPFWVDIIINNLDDGTHPFHLHGHSFYVLASHRSVHGWGSYSPFAEEGSSAIKPIKSGRPVKKDTVAVPRRGYVIVRFRADNVGIWMLHCHVLFHQATGMAMGLQIGGDENDNVLDEGAKVFCEAD